MFDQFKLLPRLLNYTPPLEYMYREGKRRGLVGDQWVYLSSLNHMHCFLFCMLKLCFKLNRFHLDLTIVRLVYVPIFLFSIENDFPIFSMAGMDKGKFLLAARRVRHGARSEYIISLDADNLSQESNAYVGKLR